jgi:CheY-like chemotaxis protein
MLRILVVDDNLAELQLLSEALRESGMTVDLHTAVCGGDAIAILDKSPVRPFDAVIVDARLPRVSGVEVIRFTRTRPELQAMPILLLTGEDCDRVQREHPDVPIERCHEKPDSFDGYVELAHRIKKDLGEQP